MYNKKNLRIKLLKKCLFDDIKRENCLSFKFKQRKFERKFNFDHRDFSLELNLIC